MKIFYTSKKYKDNWEKVFGKDKRVESKDEVIQKVFKHCFDGYGPDEDYFKLGHPMDRKDGYGLPDWRDIRFKPDSFDNFCLRNNLLDGYGQFFVEKDKEKDMNLREIVLDIITDFCDNVESFTSLDVSNMVKDSLPSTRHREVAPMVRQAYADGEMDFYGYTRTSIDVNLANGETSRAFLYHHQSVDPNSYDKRSQVAIIPKSADDEDIDTMVDDRSDAQQNFDDVLANRTNSQRVFDKVLATQRGSSKVGPSVPTYDDDDDTTNTTTTTPIESVTRETTYDGRIEIPASWVSDMGWTNGEAVYAIKDGDIIIMKGSVRAGENVLGTMYVTNGRLRLTKMASVEAGWQVSYGHSRWVRKFQDRIEIGLRAPSPTPTPTSTFHF